MTRAELFQEIKSLEKRVFELLGDDLNHEEFELVVKRTEELTIIARKEGWLR